MMHNVDVNVNQILVIHAYVKPTNLTCYAFRDSYNHFLLAW